MEVNTTWLSAAFAEKPVPVMVSGLPRTASEGDTEVITGTVKFGLTRPANSASTRQSPMFVVPFRFMSPTLFGNAGLLVPPTVNAHTSASPMFTLRSPLRSPCSMSHNWTIFENRPLGFVTFTPWFPIVASAVPVTRPVNWVPLTRVVVRFVPPSDTTAPTSKFVPLTVRIKGPPYHGATAWLNPGGLAERALMVGVNPPAGAVTVNALNGLDVPPGVVTVTVRLPVEASGAIVIVTGKLMVPPVPKVAVTPLPSIAVTPLPLKST